VEQAERRIDLARREQWPDVTVGAQYVDIAESDLTPTMDGRDALALSLGIKIPLWRGAERAVIDESELQRRAAASRLDALELDVKTELQRLEATLHRQERQLRILDQTLIPRAETALEATLSAYRTGQTDFLDVLDAERTLFQLRLDRAAIFARLLTTQAEQDRVAGRTALPGRR
jgi:outer membrane protein TolC